MMDIRPTLLSGCLWLLLPIIAWSQTREVFFQIPSPGRTRIGIVGPNDEQYVLEWSTNLIVWTSVATNDLDGFESPIPVREPVFPSHTFYRVHRFEPPQPCDLFNCFAEPGVNGTNCFVYGPPDLVSNRNSSIPSSATPIKTLRLMIHVVALDNGAEPAATARQVEEQMAKLNADFRPVRIQFVHDWRVVPNSSVRVIMNAAQDSALKQFSLNPEGQHNIFVTGLGPHRHGISTYPWITNELGETVTLTWEGGTLVSDRRFGTNEFVLTHELGHAFGLWHTHHGQEVDPCSACAESADGLYGDTTGDRCSDTSPTKIDGNGRPIGTNDVCSGRPWPLASADNFMSAAPRLGRRFTPQQAGRMHAWIEHKLTGWLDTNTPAAASDLRVVANQRFGETELFWIDNSWNETAFHIERSTDGGVSFELIAVLPSGTTSFFDPEPYVGTSYYRIIATNENVGVRSYATLPQGVTQTVTLAQTLYVDGASIAQPPDGTPQRPFSTLFQAYNIPLSPLIIRIQSGVYPETFVLSNRVLRLEALGGKVSIGTEP